MYKRQENNLIIMEHIYKYLAERMEIRCNTHVETIKRHGDGFELGVRGEDKADIRCDYLIAAPGRAGAEWFTEQCRGLGLSFINNQDVYKRQNKWFTMPEGGYANGYESGN